MSGNIQAIVFKGKHKEHYDYFDAYSQRDWPNNFIVNKKQGHEQILKLTSDGTYKTMDDLSYEAIIKLLKPRKLGKALKDATGEHHKPAHQLVLWLLGEDFIDNAELFKAARQVAKCPELMASTIS